METLIFPVTQERSSFLRVREVMKNIGLDNFISSPHLLRLENLITTRNSYNFNFYQESSDRASEVKLNRTDAFILTHLGIAVYKPTAGSEGQAPLWTWANPYTFTTAGEAACIEQFYNGTLTLTTKPVDRISNLHTSIFKYNPGWVMDANPPALAAAIGNPFWGPSFEQMGMRLIEGNVIIDGYQDNRITINVGPGDLTVADAEGDDYIVVHAFGQLVANAAQHLARYYESAAYF